MRHRQLTAALLTSIIFVPLQACTNKQINSNAHRPICTTLDIRQSCILDTAQATLETIDDPFNWASSAAELAIAYDKMENHEQAWLLLQAAKDKMELIEDEKTRSNALSEIVLAVAKLQRSDTTPGFIDSIEDLASKIKNADKQVDITGKLLTVRAVHDDANLALERARKLPSQSAAQDAFKGRTIREIAGQFAKVGDFQSAVAALDYITADFTYYSGVARTDIAATAIKAGRTDIATPLLEQAIKIGQDQENGYFRAGILRDVGYGFALSGDDARATSYFSKAREAAREAKTPQEKARSMSRIATKMADCNMLEFAAEILNESIEFARLETSQTMKNYSLYEISGSAAFTNQADISRALIIDIPDAPFGSAVSLRSAAERDLAWGQVRYGQVLDGLTTANAISSKREKIHTLSRIVRLLKTPKMNALQRYL